MIFWAQPDARACRLISTHTRQILTGTRPRYYDYTHHKRVTAPVTQTSPLLTSLTALSPGA